MEILNFTDNFIPGVVGLWNRSCKIDMPYKPFTEKSFRRKFVENPNFDYDGTFVTVESGNIVGFANGLVLREFLPGQTPENTPGYLTFVLVEGSHRRRGLGAGLLGEVESYFKAKGKKKAQVIFFNPINLEWYIPGSDNRHDHPNAPGVDVDGPGYPFLQSCGYVARTKEISLYLDLTRFEIDDKAAGRIKELAEKGIYIELYDKEKHYGLDTLFDHLKNEDWRKGVEDNVEHPLVIASGKGRIVAFAGPVKVQESGRGWFVGVGTDPAYEGMGIGTSVYFTLLDLFKKHGAKFSSIFTGVDNPARKMYERAGYSIVKTWAVMQKEL